jgi:hypothetical protein
MTTNIPSTAFKKGEKRPGQGRPKGCINKNNQLIRDMIAEALNEVGGVDYLMDCATDPKTKAAFLGLIGKVMPVQVIGDPNNPLHHAITLEVKGVSAHIG